MRNTFGFVSKNSVREALWRYKDQILKDLKIIKNAVLHQISDMQNYSFQAVCKTLVTIQSIHRTLDYLCNLVNHKNRTILFAHQKNSENCSIHFLDMPPNQHSTPLPYPKSLCRQALNIFLTHCLKTIILH